MTLYSHSQISTYLTCQLKYRYHKVDRIDTEKVKDTIHIALGNAVHETLEWLYKRVGLKNIPTLEVFLKQYKLLRDQHLKMVELIYNEEVESMTEGMYQRGVDGLKRYYLTYHPFDQAITMAMEQKVSINFDNDIQFTGFIDRFDLKDRTAYIVDYKTNQKLSPDAKDQIFDQLSLYGLGVLQEYGRKFDKVIARVIYIGLQKEDSREVTPEIIEQVKLKYAVVAEEIEKKKDQYLQWDINVFEPTKGPHCDWCNYQQICPLRSHFFMNEQATIDDISNRTLKLMIDDLFIENAKLKQLEKQVNASKQIVVQYAQKIGAKALYGNTAKVSIVSRSTYKAIDEPSLIVKLTEEGLLDDLLSINTYKLADKFKKHDLSYEDFKDVVQENISTYVHGVYELKEKEGEDT